MADELKNNNDHILIKSDAQNSLYIDPNSLIEDGQVKQRLVPHEELVMYVNLEAQIIPRSFVVFGSDTDKNKTTITSLVSGNINFLRPDDKGSNFDTTWTDLYSTEPRGEKKFYAASASQNFGIRNITIKNLMSTTPQVSITFIDVRGKTLFESPDDSPYKAFFHLPAPIFYLTLKGFYGKAVRYQLVMAKFNARFDGSTGNYEVMCDFVSPTMALLSDIPLQNVLTAPYMYAQTTSLPDRTIVKGEGADETIYKFETTSKGYQILRQVYDEYKAKKLIPEDFPTITLRDLAIMSEHIDKILETEFFDSVVDVRVLSDMDKYNEDLNYFATAIMSFGRKYVDKDYSLLSAFDTLTVVDNNPIRTNVIEEWDNIVTKYVELLENNSAFGKQPRTGKQKIQPVSITVDITAKDKRFYREASVATDNKTYFYIDNLIKKLREIQSSYIAQRKKIEDEISEKINSVIKSKEKGLGFEPTTRNIFAVILAGADTYIRLMTEVHEKAVYAAPNRGDFIKDQNEKIYPFPLITNYESEEKPSVVVYPGDESVRQKLKSDDPELWPEVEFVDDFFQAAAQVTDSLLQNPPVVQLEFPSEDENNLTYSETITWNYSRTEPYLFRTTISTFYEFYERAFIGSVYSGLRNVNTIKELAKLEAGNLIRKVTGNRQIEQRLKMLRNLEGLRNDLESLSPLKRWLNTKEDVFTTNYLRNVQVRDFDLVSIVDDKKIKTHKYGGYGDVEQEIASATPNLVNQLYPFTNSEFVSTLEDKVSGSSLLNLDFSTQDILKVELSHGLLLNELPIEKWYDGNTKNIFDDCKLSLSNGSINIFNTPYFINGLFDDIKTGNYKRSAYLFLNSLPMVNLYNKYVNTNKYVFASMIQFAAVHKLPYLFVLKLGSIWHRYKGEFLDGVLKQARIKEFFDNDSNYTLDLTINNKLKSISEIDTKVGFYPYLHDLVFNSLSGYYLYGLEGKNNAEYEAAIQPKLTNGIVNVLEPTTNNPTVSYYTAVVTSGTTTYLLPSSGGQYKDKFNSSETYQNLTARLILSDTFIEETDFSKFTTPNNTEYFRDSNDTFSISSTYKEVADLLATFKPEILDEFESEFLDFSSNNNEGTMKEIIRLISILETSSNSIVELEKAQTKNCSLLSDKLLNRWYHLKVGNPKEINLQTLKDFVEHTKLATEKSFNSSQVTTSSLDDLKNIIGLEVNTYQKFFKDFNISFNKSNFSKYRLLARYYSGGNFTKSNFPSAVEQLNKQYDDLLDLYIRAAHEEFNKIDISQTPYNEYRTRGFNLDKTLLLNQYNLHKNFNDKWIGGNVLNGKSLMDEFLFLDKGNRDIGQKSYVNLYRLQDILDDSNRTKMSLYDVIGLILKDTQFIFHALPAYTNFYGIQEIGDISRPKLSSSQIASDIFGTFMDVDFLKSSPKFVCQYVGLTSKYQDMSFPDYKFSPDAIKPEMVSNNPTAGYSPEMKRGEYDKSNRAVCFEVNFGDAAQSIFKSISLDTTSIAHTSESIAAIEQIANSKAGSNITQVSTDLYDIYSMYSYRCEIVAMGNMTIQPTMLFALKNVPMFNGIYRILDVKHDINGNNIETIFSGVRISMHDLPDVKFNMTGTNKIIYQKLLSTAKLRTKS